MSPAREDGNSDGLVDKDDWDEEGDFSDLSGSKEEAKFACSLSKSIKSSPQMAGNPVDFSASPEDNAICQVPIGKSKVGRSPTHKKHQQ